MLVPPSSSLRVQEGCNEDSPEPSLLQTEQAQLHQSFFKKQVRMSVALLWTCSYSSASFPCWGLRIWTQYTKWCLRRADWRGTVTSFPLLATSLVMPYRILLAFWAGRAHYWFTPSFSSIRIPKAALNEYFSQSLYIPGIALTQAQGVALGLVKHH